MRQILAQKSLFCLPWAQTILGTHFNGKINIMALDWLTRVNITPAMLGICMNRNNASYGAIVTTGEFNLNFPTVDIIEKTDYTGLVSGKNVDEPNLFEVFYGELKSAPMIAECPLTIECKLSQALDLPTHTFFIVEIINIYTEGEFMTESKPDMKKIKPFFLTMPDNNYWAIGENGGKAWSAGNKLRKQN